MLHILNHLYIKTNKRIDIGLKRKGTKCSYRHTGIQASAGMQATGTHAHKRTNTQAEKQKGHMQQIRRFIDTQSST